MSRKLCGRGLCVIVPATQRSGWSCFATQSSAAELCVGRVWRYAERTVVSGVVSIGRVCQRACGWVGGLQDVKFAHTDVLFSHKHANHGEEKSHTHQEIQTCS